MGGQILDALFYGALWLFVGTGFAFVIAAAFFGFVGEKSEKHS